MGLTSPFTVSTSRHVGRRLSLSLFTFSWRYLRGLQESKSKSTKPAHSGDDCERIYCRKSGGKCSKSFISECVNVCGIKKISQIIRKTVWQNITSWKWTNTVICVNSPFNYELNLSPDRQSSGHDRKCIQLHLSLPTPLNTKMHRLYNKHGRPLSWTLAYPSARLVGNFSCCY